MFGRKIFHLFFFLFFYSSNQQCSAVQIKKPDQYENLKKYTLVGIGGGVKLLGFSINYILPLISFYILRSQMGKNLNEKSKVSEKKSSNVFNSKEFSDKKLNSLKLNEEQQFLLNILSVYNDSVTRSEDVQQKEMSNQQKEELLDRINVMEAKKPRCLLLCGSSYETKLYAQKVAKQNDALFLSISCRKEFYNNSGKYVDYLFNGAIKDNHQRPLVIFLNKFDLLINPKNLTTHGESIVNSMLSVIFEEFEDVVEYKNVILCLAMTREKIDEITTKKLEIDEYFDWKVEFFNSNQTMIDSCLPQDKISENLVDEIVNNMADMKPDKIKKEINQAKWRAILKGDGILEVKHFEFDDSLR